MPQKRLSTGKINEIKELRRDGYTYRQIHKVTGVSTGTISNVCEKERPITTLNQMEKMVSEHEKTIFEFEKQFIAVRDRLIDDIISSDEDFVCPYCSSEFMDFKDDRRPYMKCPRCDYTIVFGAL
jgi:DNA-directed RNA polymerase subunit RPC12/RpoP